VTAAKLADDATARLAAIVVSSDDAIISKDLSGLITSWNIGAERMFGYTPDEVIGKPISILMPPERVSEAKQILRRIRREEMVEHFETVRRRKDGTDVIRFFVGLSDKKLGRDRGGRFEDSPGYNGA
jgi:PAS domain S-box-containing protein